MSSPHEIERYLTKYAKEATSILDVSTGLGKNGYIMRTVSKAGYIIGLDIFLPYLKKVKYHKIYDDVVLCDVSKLPIQNNKFHTTVASEVIEHLDRNQGKTLLKEIERVTTTRVIITTPNKPPARKGAQTVEGFNQYEAHCSSWGTSDFKAIGYRVFGLGLYFSRYFGSWEHNIDLIFSYTTTLFPELAAELIAVKEK